MSSPEELEKEIQNLKKHLELVQTEAAIPPEGPHLLGLRGIVGRSPAFGWIKLRDRFLPMPTPSFLNTYIRNVQSKILELEAALLKLQ